MGNIFPTILFIPYDVLGLVGIASFTYCPKCKKFRAMALLFILVLAYWFGRIGFHDPNLAASNEGWQIILWSFGTVLSKKKEDCFW
jgi:hypothetical protein